MLISNIKGKYQPASGDVMASIEIADADINNITIKNANEQIECYSTDVNVLNHFYSKYFVGRAILLRQPVIEEKDGSYLLVFAYYDSAGNETRVEMPAIAKGDVDFTSNTFVGYARKFEGVLTFVIVGNNVSEQPVDVDFVENSNCVYFVDNTIMAQNAVTIEVYDLNGRVVATSNSDQINISALNRGIYVVRSVYVDGTYQVTKVIK